ncbi:coniferyl aldehyde dehydrogenase [Rhizobium sp. SG2393]|uniref:coniferyl aldehyde dehydrogenase n=1 Tax=Rhizobium sp. SG2393 TaxID=3276279 RepID=UPI00366CD316
MDDQPLLSTLASQRAAFLKDGFPDLGLRRDRLARLGRLLTESADAFSDVISRDFGFRSHEETKLLEIAPLMGAIRHARAHLGRWMKADRRGRSFEFVQLKNHVRYQPLGVVGIMASWNYPLFVALGPLIDVLAGGNRAMIKPSELLPETSRLLAARIGAYFSPDEVSVVEGGVNLAAAFARLPFDHLVFTGSTAVGRKVMAAAAENLTPVTLELGGKSPALVAPDYPIEDAARDIAFGKLMNAGQTCIAPDYVLVERRKLGALAEAFIDRAQRFYPAGTTGSDYSTLALPRAYERLLNGLQECRERGVKILTADVARPPRGLVIAPTVVIDPPADCALMAEEIFGPVLPLVPYDDLSDALAFINARPRPLALYAFTHQSATERRILRETISGNVTVNGTLLHVTQNDLPFGGVGASGIGAYHGREGFVRFSHARGITKVRLFNPSRLAQPPYGAIAEWLKWLLMRRW